MTVQADVPIPLTRGSGLSTPVAEDLSARLLGSARSLFLHGLAVLGVAILLGIAETLAVWMGALLVAFGLLIIAGVVALVGLLSRFSIRPHH
jgi:hypothetical protein